MKRTFLLFLFSFGLFTHPVSALDVQMIRFASAKEAQVRELGQTMSSKVPSIVWSFFDAVRVDDWPTVTNLAARIERSSGRFASADTNGMSPALRTAIWQPITETLGAYEQFHEWNGKWLHRYADGIMDSIPRGSIYFGGTDPGRFLITALSESHPDGIPFFTVTQNQLADNTYRQYLWKIYNGKINLLTMEDSQTAFTNYVADAIRRKKAGGLKPGEYFEEVDGQLQVRGQVSIMEINGLLARIFVAKNAKRDFYVEESYPLDWMFPHLSPHGLILRLHPQPLSALREDDVTRDLAYWKRLTGEAVGDWITDKTSTKELCDFADKIYLRKNLSGFKGDVEFVRDPEAQQSFSKLRSALAGLYVWRARHTKDSDEKLRMQKAAGLAFRQAVALCPYSPDAVLRYCNFLMEFKRVDEALLITQTSLRLMPEDSPFREPVQDIIRALHANQ